LFLDIINVQVQLPPAPTFADHPGLAFASADGNRVYVVFAASLAALVLE
jgi:hypothetical protein